jgi:hypothetical protein
MTATRDSILQEICGAPTETKAWAVKEDIYKRDVNEVRAAKAARDILARPAERAAYKKLLFTRNV